MLSGMNTTCLGLSFFPVCRLSRPLCSGPCSFLSFSSLVTWPKNLAAIQLDTNFIVRHQNRMYHKMGGVTTLWVPYVFVEIDFRVTNWKHSKFVRKYLNLKRLHTCRHTRQRGSRVEGASVKLQVTSWSPRRRTSFYSTAANTHQRKLCLITVSFFCWSTVGRFPP